ncbi:hypothetical protein DDZ14_06280 [Maritimibacter sp. 55A14]|uniref:DsbA family protein n=1 Tax=Maritimibacter sp. 55A14 TaxID=2174844 RepID=UPI000D6222FE|nr:DsbA family protein [Maritimibacter sp. 55A14]PWE33378.1 hypothetical protein DDZ14_06280 [Maritimibacter sp. 55A14]
MTRFTYIYDTYCGWCYGAAPAIRALIESGADITVQHRHLFQGANAHRMAHGFGVSAQRFDKRIAALSGQEFSDTYVREILQSPTEVLDSGLTAAAAALIHDQGAVAEMELSRALQRARFVQGRSAADAGHVESILRDLGVTAPLSHGVSRAAETSAAAAQTLRQAGLHGVPALFRHQAGRTETIDLSTYYQSPTRVAALAA